MACSSRADLLAGVVCAHQPLTVSPRSQQRTDVELRLLEGGSITLLIGGRTQWLPARRLSVYWAGIPHQVLAHEGRENWLLRIPLAWLLARGLPANFINGLLEGRVFFEPDVDDFDCDLFRMRLWSGDVGTAIPLNRRAMSLEVEARLTRLAATLPPKLPPLTRDPPSGRSGATKAEQLAEFISRHFAEPLDAARIGRAIRTHPTYTTSMFRRKLGNTPNEYLTQHRLACALRLLLTTKDSIATIARQSGFGSAKRLNTTFRQSFKLSPSAFRREHHLLMTTGCSAGG
jgi:AraC family transcriptional regulator, melibiose operon regulatory protein